MRTLVRFMLCALLMTPLISCAAMDAKQPLPEDIRGEIARAYGIEAFDQIAEIQYQFNVKANGELTERKWIWMPKNDTVVYQGRTSQLYGTEYQRSELAENPSRRHARIDAWFVNDRQWLLFPFQLLWDTQARVEAVGRDFLPIGWGRALKVRVTYPGRDGQSPGDVYELFVDENYRLLQWVYLPGGSAKDAKASTWEKHRQVGPITVALDHQGKSGDFRVWFTRVAVRLEGQEALIMAE